jgi:hypothetical protein
MKEMNSILGNSEAMKTVNLCFIRKAVFSMVRLERVLPRSWGIDVETGNWLSVLHQLKRILPDIYKPQNCVLN